MSVVRLIFLLAAVSAPLGGAGAEDWASPPGGPPNVIKVQGSQIILPHCPPGFGGAPPNCTPPVPQTPTCPNGMVGAFPNCTPPPPLIQTLPCPIGIEGATPFCQP